MNGQRSPEATPFPTKPDVPEVLWWFLGFYYLGDGIQVCWFRMAAPPLPHQENGGKDA